MCQFQGDYFKNNVAPPSLFSFLHKDKACDRWAVLQPVFLNDGI